MQDSCMQKMYRRHSDWLKLTIARHPGVFSRVNLGLFPEQLAIEPKTPAQKVRFEGVADSTHQILKTRPRSVLLLSVLMVQSLKVAYISRASSPICVQSFATILLQACYLTLRRRVPDKRRVSGQNPEVAGFLT